VKENKVTLLTIAVKLEPGIFKKDSFWNFVNLILGVYPPSPHPCTHTSSQPSPRLGSRRIEITPVKVMTFFVDCPCSPCEDTVQYLHKDNVLVEECTDKTGAFQILWHCFVGQICNPFRSSFGKLNCHAFATTSCILQTSFISIINLATDVYGRCHIQNDIFPKVKIINWW
jgi:hypothetical protein